MPQSEAVVVATYSRRMRLRLPDGAQVESRIKGKTLQPVCGDRVTATRIDNEDDWLITAIRQRRNTLSRPNLRGKVEVLAANIDLLVAVAAARPAPDWFVIDRYLCAAENMGARAAVVFNKTDIGEADRNFRDFADIGYPVIACSAALHQHIDELQAVFSDDVAIITGQSGVGKSTLINALLGRESLPTGDISSKSSEGRHTTVNSQMLELPAGGQVIDSPGVRDFAPALDQSAQVAVGFREIAAAAVDCRFANCRHLREPDCAVKDAVDSLAISARRYESYRRLLALTGKLERKR